MIDNIVIKRNMLKTSLKITEIFNRIISKGCSVSALVIPTGFCVRSVATRVHFGSFYRAVSALTFIRQVSIHILNVLIIHELIDQSELAN